LRLHDADGDTRTFSVMKVGYEMFMRRCANQDTN